MEGVCMCRASLVCQSYLEP